MGQGSDLGGAVHGVGLALAEGKRAEEGAVSTAHSLRLPLGLTCPALACSVQSLLKGSQGQVSCAPPSWLSAATSPLRFLP